MATSGDNDGYYDIVLVGRTGMGKSTTGNKILGVETTDQCHLRWFSRGVCDFLSVPLGDGKKHFPMSGQETEYCKNRCGLISNEETKVRVLDVPGFSGMLIQECGEGKLTKLTVEEGNLQIMRWIIRVQAAMELNIRRVVYFLPYRGTLERADATLLDEIKLIYYYFGESFFNVMVLVATCVPLAKYQMLGFTADELYSSKRAFSIGLERATERRFPCPPIIYISMTDSGVEIKEKIHRALVIKDEIVPFPLTHISCALQRREAAKGKKAEECRGMEVAAREREEHMGREGAKRDKEEHGGREAAEQEREEECRRREVAEWYREECRRREAAELERDDECRRREAAEQEREEEHRRRMDAELRAHEAEDQTRHATVRSTAVLANAVRTQEKSEPSWTVDPEEIHLTGHELGRGGWGTVEVAMFRGTRVAAKRLHEQIAGDYYCNLFIREMNIAAHVRHPNIVLFMGATIHGDYIILTELMDRNLRSLLDPKNPPSSHECKSIALDVVTALNYLHQVRPEPIIHRDISSANVLLERRCRNTWRAKVCDFGTANYARYVVGTKNPGALVYAAPEADNPPQHSVKLDIFSFGILLMEMYTATFPLVEEREQLILSIKDDRIVSIIQHCKAEDKNTRPTASEIIKKLSSI